MTEPATDAGIEREDPGRGDEEARARGRCRRSARPFAARSCGPANAGYDEARQIWNAMIDRRPGADRALHRHRRRRRTRCGFAREHGLLVLGARRRPQHRRARGVRGRPDDRPVADARRLGRPGGRARRARRPAARSATSIARPSCTAWPRCSGFVSATGIAGLTIGGGFGYLTRRHGWTCDNLVSMEVVTADGKVVRVSDDENAELFWCLRGGSGNFGIVTSFEYQLYPGRARDPGRRGRVARRGRARGARASTASSPPARRAS